MNFDWASQNPWVDDLVSNGFPAVVGFLAAQGWRYVHRIWTRRRARGPMWSGLRDGLAFVFVSKDVTWEELRAQLTVANHCAGLRVANDPRLFHADESLEGILGRNLLVLHTARAHNAGEPTSSVLRGWLRGWGGTHDNVQDLFQDILQPGDESRVAYLIRVPNPHMPDRSIVVLGGPHARSAWAAAIWMCDPRFERDSLVASGQPFVHRLGFDLTEGVPFVETHSVTGQYLVRHPRAVASE